jgi:hypothetical protein
MKVGIIYLQGEFLSTLFKNNEDQIFNRCAHCFYFGIAFVFLIINYPRF